MSGNVDYYVGQVVLAVLCVVIGYTLRGFIDERPRF